MSPRRYLAAVLLLVAATLPAARGESNEPGDSGWEAFPVGLLERPYLADPLQPRFGAAMIEAAEPAISDTGARRWALNLGGRFGLIRRVSRDHPGRPWQLDIEAGFLSYFDIDNSQDNIGWDGIYGLALTKRLSDQLALKVALKHFSSHIGDELQERTGRRRINYTREESIVGIAWQPDSRWRLYGEVAHGHELRNSDLQEPGRFQVGMEYASPRTLMWRLRGYAALNISSFEESDWNVDTTAQAGVSWPAGSKLWRAGVEYHDGRPAMGEFFQERESWVGLGVWLDL